MASAMLGLSKILGIPKPFCAKALLSGAMAVRRHTAAVEKQGKALLATLRPDDKVLVLITRNYGVSDPILNMGIPELLLERGYKVITLSHLPGHALDISDESLAFSTRSRIFATVDSPNSFVVWIVKIPV